MKVLRPRRPAVECRGILPVGRIADGFDEVPLVQSRHTDQDVRRRAQCARWIERVVVGQCLDPHLGVRGADSLGQPVHEIEHRPGLTAFALNQRAAPFAPARSGPVVLREAEQPRPDGSLRRRALAAQLDEAAHSFGDEIEQFGIGQAQLAFAAVAQAGDLREVFRMLLEVLGG